MSIVIPFNGTNYLMPTTGESGWATVVTNFFVDLGANALTSSSITRNGLDRGTVALTPGATIATNCALGNIFTVTLNANAVLNNPSNMQAGAHYVWAIKQDSTGGRTMTYGTAFKWSNATVPSLTGVANAVDVISAFSPDGTNIYGLLALNFG